MRNLLIILLLLAMVACQGNKKSENKQKAGGGQKKDFFAQAATDGNVVLKINDLQFTNGDFRRFIKLQFSQISDFALKEELLQRIFQQYVDHLLVLCKSNQDKLSVGDAEVREYVRKLGLETAKIDNSMIRDVIQVQKYLYDRIYSGIDASNQEIRQYYNDHRNDFQKKDEIELYQILVKDQDLALRIRGTLENHPEQFEDLARKDSQAPESVKGGFMGRFQRGELPQEMEQAVFSLDVNSISQILRTSYGFHIFKVAAKKNGRFLYFDKVREDIRGKLISEKTESVYQDFLKQLKTENRVEIFTQNLFFLKQEKKGEIEKNEHQERA